MHTEWMDTRYKEIEWIEKNGYMLNGMNECVQIEWMDTNTNCFLLALPLDIVQSDCEVYVCLKMAKIWQHNQLLFERLIRARRKSMAGSDRIYNEDSWQEWARVVYTGCCCLGNHLMSSTKVLWSWELPTIPYSVVTTCNRRIGCFGSAVICSKKKKICNLQASINK